MSKFRKLLRKPGPFLRDHLCARYPRVWNEVGCPEELEARLVEHQLRRESAQSPDFPIDIVYTWVDGSDPAWRARYAQAHSCSTPVPDDLARDPARFQAHDEIGHSVRSVLRHLPWVRHIHIVTDDQMPQGLPDDPRIRIVHHRDLIAPEHRPTFNSHVIEAHLHRIAGLSEHFIYFNDDVLVARDLPPGHFFQPNGLAALFVADKSLDAMTRAGRATPTLQACRNSQAVLRRLHGQAPDQPLVHTYLPLRRRAIEDLWQVAGPEIRAFLGNRVRGADDLNLASFLAPWHAFHRGWACLGTDICYYLNVRSAAAPSYYDALLRRRDQGASPHSMCLNDFRSSGPVLDGYAGRLHQFLAALDAPCPDSRRSL